MNKQELQQEGRHDTLIKFADMEIRAKDNRRRLYDVLADGELKLRVPEYEAPKPQDYNNIAQL